MRRAVEYRMASRINYKRFKTEFPDIDLSYLEWSNIVYKFNYGIRDYILETGEKFKLPWGFGDLSVSKKRRKKTITLPNGEERINLPIDWQKTKRAGKKIYHFNFHTDGFSFKWYWFVSTARIKQYKLWVFKPSRLTSRMLNHYLKQDGQHYKYKEWNSAQ